MAANDEHYAHVDELPQDTSKPTEGQQSADEGFDCLYCLMGGLFFAVLVLASVTGHAAISANYVP